MKKVVIIFLFCIPVPLTAQNVFTNTEKLASLCKVWGFLKYYHPGANKGKQDWDKELIKYMQPVLAANDKTELNRIYRAWICDLGRVKKLRKPHIPPPDDITNSLDLKWMDDGYIFTDTVSAMLHNIAANKKGSKNYYVRRKFLVGNPDFRKEKKYEDSLYPSAQLRFVALCRYWNIVQYYFPDKYLMDRNWDSSLADLIPSFVNAKDTNAYCIAMISMLAKTTDSHAGLGYPKMMPGGVARMMLPFKYTILDNKAIVTAIYNDSLAKIDDLQYGDVIESINGKTVKDIIGHWSKFICASNEATMLYRFSEGGLLNTGGGDTALLTIDRNGKIITKAIHKCYYTQLHYLPVATDESKPAKILNHNIGYLDLGILHINQVGSAMKLLKNTDALIIDVRNYPHLTGWKICRKLTNRRKPFAKFTKTVWRYPGTFRYTRTEKCGRKKSHSYKGKIIVLCNEQTQSHAEYTCMMFKTLPHVTVIGSQTAGADGDVSQIVLPGGYHTFMTGLGVYYPEGERTQRIGIVPDIMAKPTIEGIRQHKDEILERAVAYILNGI